MQAALVTPSVLLCPMQTRDETLLCNPFSSRSVKLVLVLASAVAKHSPHNLSPPYLTLPSHLCINPTYLLPLQAE